MKDFRENLQKCQSYIQALEEERRKIQVFQRELPLCLELVTQAIDACKQQLSGASNGIKDNNNNNSECTSEEGPIFEEFIPLKRSHSSDDDDEHHDYHKDEMSDDHINNVDDHDGVDKSEKCDWLRSVQLWNQTPDPPTTHQVQEHQPKRVPVVELTNSAQQKIEEKSKAASDEKKTTAEPANPTDTNNNTVAVSRPAGSSSGGDGSTKKETEKGGQSSQRKARRCWSPELHKRFLHALQQLGGSHAATPKQIRELMKVEGLTNDEVKSHLQKYRLHTRRSPTSTSNNHSTDQQSHQFVVVGGIWMPPSEFNSMAPVATNSRETSPNSVPNNIYAPIATMASPSSHSERNRHKQGSQSHEERGSHSHGGVHSNSTSTSSSTHTTTASQSR